METRSPIEAADRYETFLQKTNKQIKGSNILIFGYGGYLGTSIELLERGAKQVHLYDKYAKPNHRKNRHLVDRYSKYLAEHQNKVIPNSAFIRIINNDIREFARENHDIKFDLVLSGSVLEHVEDVDEQIEVLYLLTEKGGLNLHFIDLRDHYFKYPFHMLCYKEQVWKKFLNPGSNLNRLRYNDYKTILSTYFSNINIDVIERNDAAFNKMKKKIRPEFLTGDDHIDAIMRIAVTALKSGSERSVTDG